MKNSEIYKTAILALLFREKDMETSELSEDDLCEVLYKLTQDWYWSRESEKNEAAKAKMEQEEADHAEG